MADPAATGGRPPFRTPAPEIRARLFRADYAPVPQAGGDELYVSRVAWRWFDYLQPGRWRDGEKSAVLGERLAGGRGTVTACAARRRISRRAISWRRFPAWRRILNRGPHRLRTKMPLAIFSPPQKYALWQTGRQADIFRAHQQAMAHDQFENGLAQVKLDMERDDLEIFAWIDGIDAEEIFNRGLIDAEMLGLLARSSNHALSRLGYRVLDDKPRHLIVRPRPDGTLLQRHEDTVPKRR